jgi:DNA-binding HxlR family transcriptional regulator
VTRTPVPTKHRRKTQVELAASMRESKKGQGCPEIESIRKVGNEVRLIVVSRLINRPLRFKELLEAANGVDAKSLSRVLKYLASEGIVGREVLNTAPLAVRYSLTEKGKELGPVVEALRKWGERWVLPQEIIVKN